MSQFPAELRVEIFSVSPEGRKLEVSLLTTAVFALPPTKGDLFGPASLGETVWYPPDLRVEHVEHYPSTPLKPYPPDRDSTPGAVVVARHVSATPPTDQLVERCKQDGWTVHDFRRSR